jgi:peptidoglycan-associated lipoprotein
MKFSSITKAAGLLVLATGMNVTLIGSSAYAQPAAGQDTTSGPGKGSEQGSALTGGAEGAPTDQATPAPSSATGPTSSMSGNSGKGNAVTGGAEGAPTDQATPSPATGKMPQGSGSRPGDPPPNMKASQSE